MSHAPNDDAPMGDDLPDDLAAAPEPDSSGSRSVGRRTFLKGVTVGAGSLAAGGASIKYGTQEAEALAVTTAVGIAAGGAAVGYLLKGQVDNYLGDSADYSNYTGIDALHSAVYEASLDMKQADEAVLTSIENNITNAQNVALAKGKAAAIEAMNTGASESEAVTAVNEAIDSYFAVIEENILSHYQAQINQIRHHIDSLNNHQDGDSDLAFSWWYYDNQVWNDGNNGAPVDVTQDITLLDGSTFTLNTFKVKVANASDTTLKLPFESASESNPSHEPLGYINPDDSSVSAYPLMRFNDVFEAVTTERDAANSTLNGFVADVYAAYDPGEIPTEDLVDPITASTELAQNYDGYQAQGAYAAMLGLPTTAEHSVNLTVHTADGDRNIWADIYTEYVPTDASGNEIGFESGTTYDPSTWDKPLYIAYEYTEETQDGTTTSTDFVQLEDSFTIDVIEDKDGNEVDSFKTTSRNNQTSDVSKLKEELEQIREAQLEMQEEAQSGGAGGFSFDQFAIGDIPGVATIAMIGGGILLLLNDD